MKFLASRNVSLACAVINGVLTLNFVTDGSWVMAIVAAAFCGLCTRNYLNT